MRTLILVEPEIPENTGFIARLAANFDYSLRIVNPEFNLSEARETASGAQEKLREARIFEDVKGAVRDLDYVVGTKPGRGVGLKQFTPRGNTSIMVGRESSGLSNEELELCDAVVHIETQGYESLNQSHAASVLMYEFSCVEETGMDKKEKQALESRVDGDMLRKLLVRSNPSSSEFKKLMADIGND